MGGPIRPWQWKRSFKLSDDVYGHRTTNIVHFASRNKLSLDEVSYVKIIDFSMKCYNLNVRITRFESLGASVTVTPDLDHSGNGRLTRRPSKLFDHFTLFSLTDVISVNAQKFFLLYNVF